jgi:hypothetical protein
MEPSVNSRRRRFFQWSDEARGLISDYGAVFQRDGAGRKQLLMKLSEVSGNPPDACLRLLQRLGVAGKRRYRDGPNPSDSGWLS